MNFTSFAGLTDVTHLGIFTIATFSHIPNLVMLAPTNKAEYLAMLEWSVEQTEHPVMILMPGNGVVEDGRTADTDYGDLNKYKVEQKGEEVAIIAAGDFYQRGEELSQAIKRQLGFTPTLINPRFLSGIDSELLNSLKVGHSLVITLEDGIKDGGFGERIASFYGDDPKMRVLNYGLEKEFYDRYDPEELLEQLGLTTEQIVADVQKLF